MLESFLIKLQTFKPVFYCEYCKIFKNTWKTSVNILKHLKYFEKHLRTFASENQHLSTKFTNESNSWIFYILNFAVPKWFCCETCFVKVFLWCFFFSNSFIFYHKAWYSLGFKWTLTEDFQFWIKSNIILPWEIVKSYDTKINYLWLG